MAVSISLALASSGQAAGLSGEFSPEKWVLLNSNADQAFPAPSNTCTALGYAVACVNLVDEATGLFEVVGSAETYAGGANAPGAVTSERSTSWYVTNLAVPQLVSFQWFFSNGEDDTDIASYRIRDGITIAETELSTVPTSVAAVVSNLVIPANGSLAFQVRTTDNLGYPGILSISGFNATPVPGPLPIIGLAAGFGFTRKLRTRIRAASTPGVQFTAPAATPDPSFLA